MADNLRYINVNGVRLGYEVRSEGSGKPPAVFAHGYTGRSTGDELYGGLLRELARLAPPRRIAGPTAVSEVGRERSMGGRALNVCFPRRSQCRLWRRAD